MDDFNDLKQLTVIADDEVTRQHYSVDASIFQVMPAAVAKPQNLEELQNLVRAVRERAANGERISLTARAAGTCMSGGPLSESIVVDFTTNFNGVGAVDTARKRISVGSGSFYRDVEKVAATSGLLFPPYTSSKDLCAIGGMIGNNASGEKSLRYGATINWVRSLHVVLDDGNEYEFGPLNGDELRQKCQLEGREGDVYRAVTKLLDDNWDVIQHARPKVRKNAAGYGLWRIWNDDKTEFNLAKLFVGAQGTLGMITGATLDLVDAPKTTRMIVIAIDNLNKLAEALLATLSQHPEGLEVYDKHTYDLAKEYLPEDAAAAASMAEGQEMVLFAQFADPTEDQTNQNARVCQRALQKKGFRVDYVTDQRTSDAHWNIRRQSYKLLKDHAPGNKRAVPFIEDTIVNVNHYAEFLAALETILADYDMTYTYAGHIGDGSIRLIPLVDMEAPNAPEQIFELAGRVYDLVFAFGGSMSVDHNDGLIRTPFLPRMYTEDIMKLFTETKHIFDPMNLFNPGKKVGGDMAYSMSKVMRNNHPQV